MSPRTLSRLALNRATLAPVIAPVIALQAEARRLMPLTAPRSDSWSVIIERT